MPCWSTPLGMMDLVTLPQSPLLMSKPVPGSPGLGQEGLALQSAREAHSTSRWWLGLVRWSPAATGDCELTPCSGTLLPSSTLFSFYREMVRLAFRREERRHDSEELRPHCLSLGGAGLSLHP